MNQPEKKNTSHYSNNLTPIATEVDPIPTRDTSEEQPIHIATISSGFEQSDFLVRELKGQRVYFDFFEEAFNYLANKGYTRMKGELLKEWMNIIESAHDSIPKGTTYRTGSLIMVMSRPASFVKAEIMNGSGTMVEGTLKKNIKTGDVIDEPHNDSGFV